MHKFIGDVDFFINGGKHKPTCIEPICSHLYSIYFYIEIINDPNKREGYRCKTMHELDTSNCMQNEIEFYFGSKPQPRYVIDNYT